LVESFKKAEQLKTSRVVNLASQRVFFSSREEICF